MLFSQCGYGRKALLWNAVSIRFLWKIPFFHGEFDKPSSLWGILNHCNRAAVAAYVETREVFKIALTGSVVMNWTLSFWENKMDLESLTLRLKKELKPFQYRIEKESDGQLVRWNLTFSDMENRKREQIRKQIGRIVAGTVIDDRLFIKLWENVEKKFTKFSEPDRNMILFYAVNSFQQLAKIGRLKQMIYRKALDVLDESDEICIDGFEKFRMKEVNNQIELCVEEGFDRFLVEREYEEFIILLRSFLEIQQPIVEEVHITAKRGKYCLLDEKLLPIDSRLLFGIEAEEEREDMSEEDKLISVLIALAPSRVIIHGTEIMPNTIRETITSIFRGKVRILQQPHTRKN